MDVSIRAVDLFIFLRVASQPGLFQIDSTEGRRAGTHLEGFRVLHGTVLDDRAHRVDLRAACGTPV